MASRRTRWFGALLAAWCVLAVASCGGGATSEPTPSPVANQTVVEFPGLAQPAGFGVDGAGNLYVLDNAGCCAPPVRVLKLAKGSAAPQVLPFTGLSFAAEKLSVDPSGNVLVLDGGRVVSLMNGAATSTELNPESGPASQAGGVAACCGGKAYIIAADGVWLVGADGARQQLPFTGLDGPRVSAADVSGALYVVDTNPELHDATAQDRNRVLKLAPGAAGIAVVAKYGRAGEFEPVAVAAADSTVYVADSAQRRVLAFGADGAEPTTMPFTGLQAPAGLGVDAQGGLYVFDSSTGRVLILDQSAGDR